MIKEITKRKFETRFPKKRTYCDLYPAVYLENGVILINSEWNGEAYNVDGKIYKPIYICDTFSDEVMVIGYDERG